MLLPQFAAATVDSVGLNADVVTFQVRLKDCASEGALSPPQHDQH